MEIILAQPRSFCAGVERAISILEKALLKYGVPVYVKHEIVHNTHVVNYFKEKGAVFVESLNEVPHGAVIIFSAHGVSKTVEEQARQQNLHVIDATCPLVKKVHKLIAKYDAEKKHIILIGKRNHPEIVGSIGQIEHDMSIVENIDDVENLNIAIDQQVAYVTQTTLSVDDSKEMIERLKKKFPLIGEASTSNICYATQNRQNAIKDLASESDIILIVGSSNSSNSNKLRDIASQYIKKAYLINDETKIDLSWFDNVHKIGISAGASAPEDIVQQIITFLQNNFNISTIRNTISAQENVIFTLPFELRCV